MGGVGPRYHLIHVVYFDLPSNISSQVKVGQLDVEGQNPTRSFVRRGKQKGTSEEEAQTLEGFEPVEHEGSGFLGIFTLLSANISKHEFLL